MSSQIRHFKFLINKIDKFFKHHKDTIYSQNFHNLKTINV